MDVTNRFFAPTLQFHRATTDLARLKRDQGERQEAHELLAPIYNWFTEGFKTLYLKDAKNLLGHLA
jgi:predicted ATPase